MPLPRTPLTSSGLIGFNLGALLRPPPSAQSELSRTLASGMSDLELHNSNKILNQPFGWTADAPKNPSAFLGSIGWSMMAMCVRGGRGLLANGVTPTPSRRPRSQNRSRHCTTALAGRFPRCEQFQRAPVCILGGGFGHILRDVSGT